ncbi:MAG: phage portal protein [Pseudomonadota bacterium]
MPEAAPPTNRTVNRYLRDTGSGVIARRPAPLVDHRDATRQVWTRAAGLATDMIRNSGRLKGAVDQVLADTVGVELVLNPRPDLSLLGYSTEEAAEWIATVKRRWKAYAWNPAECDLRGKLTIPEMVDIALRHEIAFGECLALHDYMPPAQRRHYGVETGVKTLMVTPSRLVQETSETQRLFQGVFHDENGRATAYKIRRSGSGAWQYDIFPSHDADGRKMVTHLFQHQDADDVRGISPLAASFKKELQAEMLDDATSQMAILQTLFAVTLTSNSPSAEAFEAIQAFSNEIRSDELKEAYAGYFLSVMKRAAENSVSVGTDPAVSHLALDEKLNFETPKVPGPDYQPFKASLGREAARAIGITYGAYSMDHSSATYSSVRMDSATIWPVVLRRRRRIAAPLPQSIYELWLEEEVATGRTPLKGGYEAFLTHRHALCSANWQGPAKPTADDQKSARASSEKIENGTSSLARECADLGVDADEVFAERLAEHRRYVDAGMVSPFERGSGPSKVVADTTAGTTGQ